MCKLNPKVEFAFKKLFGSEENKSILIAFINSILDEKNKINDIELKNPYNISNYKNGKMTILDIKAVDENGIWYDIEMQIAEQEDENIKKAVEKLEIMYLNKEEREIYENDLKALLIHKAEIKTAEEKGEKRGEKNKAIEIALEMLKDGESIEKIVKYLKLSENDILELKKKL